MFLPTGPLLLQPISKSTWTDETVLAFEKGPGQQEAGTLLERLKPQASKPELHFDHSTCL